MAAGYWILKPQNSQLWYKTVNDWVNQMDWEVQTLTAKKCGADTLVRAADGLNLTRSTNSHTLSAQFLRPRNTSGLVIDAIRGFEPCRCW